MYTQRNGVESRKSDHYAQLTENPDTQTGEARYPKKSSFIGLNLNQPV